ncbi:sulfotransferase family 2 domain-containing protein [Paraglaciecola sp. L3A3]|uniref:sulfotransferase family 2 domain-containing protein n=1 Tax=Paraglaciecola sp. L3A3 TaxID=2686358 RepID=UPI00131BBDF6|nr:sulfotransferase family 2 domain-containing protein [Paraglaciecola sp. L3A3]
MIRKLEYRFKSFESLNKESQPNKDKTLSSTLSDTGYCFIHIPKNGGTTVEKLIYKTKSVKHRKWYELYAMAPKEYIHWNKFCIIRNPYDRFLSAYNYLHHGGRNAIDSEIGRRYVKPYNDINEFIKALDNVSFKNKIMSYFHFQTQSEYILSDDDICMVNNLLSFENFDTDLADFLGIQAKQVLHANKTIGHGASFPDLNEYSLTLLRQIYDRDFILYASLSEPKSDMYMKNLSTL